MDAAARDARSMDTGAPMVPCTWVYCLFSLAHPHDWTPVCKEQMCNYTVFLFRETYCWLAVFVWRLVFLLRTRRLMDVCAHWGRNITQDVTKHPTAGLIKPTKHKRMLAVHKKNDGTIFHSHKLPSHRRRMPDVGAVRPGKTLQYLNRYASRYT